MGSVTSTCLTMRRGEAKSPACMMVLLITRWMQTGRMLFSMSSGMQKPRAGIGAGLIVVWLSERAASDLPAAVATAATTTAAASTPAAATFAPGASFVHGEVASIDVLAVEGGDRGLSGIVVKFDESESARTTRFPIQDQGRGLHGAVLGEHGLEFLLRRVE